MMTVPQVLYGLDRLPSTLAADDVRLPSVELGPEPLRLNSVPLPADWWGPNTADHGERIAAVRAWLLAGCGDYNEALRRNVTRYLDAVAAHVDRHRDVLAAGLARFHGLYRVEDWCWSALRPLPRAWWQQDGAWRCADLAFWSGNEVFEVQPGDFDTSDLPLPLQHFWNRQILPVSPFRRIYPGGPDALSLTLSSRERTDRQ
jgi:hypothetical protein